MCLICVEFDKQRMTIRDAQRALREMVETLEDEHVAEVRAKLREAQRITGTPDAKKP